MRRLILAAHEKLNRIRDTYLAEDQFTAAELDQVVKLRVGLISAEDDSAAQPIIAAIEALAKRVCPAVCGGVN